VTTALLGVEVFFLVLGSVASLILPSSSFEPGADGGPRFVDTVVDLLGLLLAAVLVAGMKLLGGSNYFRSHNRMRKVVILAVPGVHVLGAAACTGVTLQYADAFWFVPSWLWFVALTAGFSFGRYWNDGPAPTVSAPASGPNFLHIGTLGVLLITAIVMLAAFLMPVYEHNDELATDADIVRNETELTMVRARLAQVYTSLESLPVRDEAPSGASTFSDCHVESGTLYQPAMAKYWKPTNTDTQPIINGIAQDLGARGWRVEQQDSRLWPWVELRSPEGWTGRGVVYSNYEKTLIGLEVQIQDAAPCSLTKG
jgi:hypothetical protein